MNRSGAGEGVESVGQRAGAGVRDGEEDRCGAREGVEGGGRPAAAGIGEEGVDRPGTDESVERDVESYLRETPEFFVRHRDLVAGLEIPHERGGAVSLVQYQVGALRREVVELRARVAGLVANARHNEDRARRMHGLTLRLLEAGGLDELLAGFYESMGEVFGVDRAVVKLVRPPVSAEHAGLGEFVTGDGTLEAIARSQIPVCGGLDEARRHALFGGFAAEIGSAVAVGLEDSIGVLALGSRDPDRFGARMGTLFLRQLAALLSHALRRHVVR